MLFRLVSVSAVMLPVIPKVQHVDRVPWMQTQCAATPLQREVVLYSDCPLVKEHMAVRTEAQNILWHIGTIVGTCKGSNVCALRIRAGPSLEPNRTHLAPVIVQGFDVACDVRTPNNALKVALCCNGSPAHCSTSSAKIRRTWRLLSANIGTPGGTTGDLRISAKSGCYQFRS